MRAKKKAHEARVSNDLIAIILPCAGLDNDNSLLGILMKDLVSDSHRETKYDSICPAMDGDTWRDDRIQQGLPKSGLTVLQSLIPVSLNFVRMLHMENV